jgi:hypothetical protein
VSPAKDGWTCVFDEATESQDESEMVTCGEQLTRLLQVAGLGVIVHDGDTLACWTFDKGRVVDSYDSWPAYFQGGDPEPKGGDARTMCRALGRPEAVETLHVALHGRRGRAEATSLHAEIVDALGMPQACVSMGFLNVDCGDYEADDPDAASFPMTLVRPSEALEAPVHAPAKASPPNARRPGDALPKVASEEDMARLVIADGALPTFLDFIDAQVRNAQQGQAARVKGLRGQVPFLRALHRLAPSGAISGRIANLIEAVERLA